MIDRVENNVNRAEPVREIARPKEGSLQKTDKPFVAELEEKLSERKKKEEEKEEKDRIILHEKDKKTAQTDDVEKEQKSKAPSDGQVGSKIDLMA